MKRLVEKSTGSGVQALKSDTDPMTGGKTAPKILKDGLINLTQQCDSRMFPAFVAPENLGMS